MGQINLNNFKVITDKLNTFFVDNKFMVASEIPTEGEFKVGDIIINNGPTNVDEPMWICIEAGNPGTWIVFNSGGGSGGGKLTTARNRVVLDGESKSEVSIGVSGFNKASDVLMVFINSRFMTEGVDYEINDDSTKIVAIGEAWNEELSSEFEIEMIVFKMMGEEGVVSSVNEIVKLKNTVVVNEAVNEVEIGIDGFNEGDDLTVYRNSVYMIEGIDYEVQGSKIVSLKGAWNAEGGSDYKFTFEVLKTVAKVNPDAVVGMEHLTEDVKEAIEAAGNIDLSGYATKEELNNIDMSGKQDKTDNGLVTTDKTIVGAINELFQDVDSGKQLIADAIDDSSINKNSTFGAMSEAIEGIHADREEDRQKLVEILQGSNMDITGTESMDTLLDLIDMSNLDLSKVIQVACGYQHTFILYDDGSLYSCGYNDRGQLGLGDVTTKYAFTQVTTNINNDVKQVACGQGFTFILKNDGSVWSCGGNFDGYLGLGDYADKYTFTQVTTNVNNDVKQIACGYGHTMIIKNDGSLWACGYSTKGALGVGDGNTHNTFAQVTTNVNNDVKEVYCGALYTFILKNDGTVWSCGNNNYGQLGLGTSDSNSHYTFAQVTTNVNNVKQICASVENTIMVKNDGSLWACGSNAYGELGFGTTGAYKVFTQVTTNINNDVKYADCGYRHVFIVKNDGSLWSCGKNNNGSLGLGDTASRTTFTQVTTNVNNDVDKVYCAEHTTFVLKTDGRLWSCGNNQYGQLGLGDNEDKYTLTEINAEAALQTQLTSLQLEAITNRGNLATVLTDEGVELTGDETLADLIVKTDEEFDRQVVPAGTATAGNVLSGQTFINSTGQLVTGTMANRGGAQTVTPGTSNKTLNAGYYSGNITIAGDVDLVAANIVSGKNIFGVNGTATSTSLGGVGVKQLICSPNSAAPFMFIIKNDGTVWSCGEGNSGQLGLNSTLDKNIFTQVTTNVSNVKQISCGYNHTLMLKNDGSLWGTGNSSSVGLGSATIRTFTQVTTNINNDVKHVICGMYCSFIIKNDGSLWATGNNASGQLGLGDTTNRDTFTQVTTNINNDVLWVMPYAIANSSSGSGTSQVTVLIKTDGSIYVAGFYNKTNQTTFMLI